MKISFMTWVAPDWTLEEHLTAAIRYGYDGIEPRCGGQGHGIDLDMKKKDRPGVRAQFEDCGVFPCCLATSLHYNVVDPQARQEQVEETKQYLQLAGDIGAPNLRVFGGAAPEEPPMEQAVEYVTEALAQCVQTADDCGVNLCLETHDAFCNATHVGQAIKNVAHPRLGACWDIMHPQRAGQPVGEAHQNLSGHVYHCHVHDGSWEGPRGELKWELMGEGLVPHAEALKLLAADGFEGYLSGEWIKAFPPEEILPQAATALREWIAAAREV
jgi:sugar phosphate isomerase/epimerase